MPQKFIINNDNLILGNVDHHVDLAKNHTTTKGGGWWHIDSENKKIYLYSKSLQFKHAKFADVLSAVNYGKLPEYLKDYEFYFSHADSLQDAMRYSIKIKKK